MPKFAEEIAQHVKLFMFHPELATRNNGRVYWVKKTADSNYTEFVAQHPAYEDAQAAVYTTVQAAIDVTGSNRNNVIFVSPGDYEEILTIDGDNDYLTIIGLGGRGAVAIEPTGANDVAITIEGTSANRVQNITLVNIGGHGDGTGGGLLIKGNVRRVRAYECKFEADSDGAYAVRLESTAAGSVGDTILDDCEFAWCVDAIQTESSGGGDPVTQTLVRNSFFHNCSAKIVEVGTVETKDFWFVNNTVGNMENATEPTVYLDMDTVGTTGLVSGNRFATNLWDNTDFAIAAGVIFVGNFAEAEGPATGGGTSGRPDA